MTTDPNPHLAPAQISNDLVDSRALFLGRLQDNHLQCDQLHRAHYTTMMLLARLGDMDPRATDPRPSTAGATASSAAGGGQPVPQPVPMSDT